MASKFFDRTRDYEWAYQTGGFAVADARPAAADAEGDAASPPRKMQRCRWREDMTETAKTYAVSGRSDSHRQPGDHRQWDRPRGRRQIKSSRQAKARSRFRRHRGRSRCPRHAGLNRCVQGVVGLSGALNNKKADQDQTK